LKNEKNIKSHIYGDWLFPDDIETDLGEKVRKTIRPLAARAITGSFIDSLKCMSEDDL